MNSSLRLSPRDLWLLALITIAWGVNWPIMKLGVEGLPPMTFRCLSMVIGLPLLAAIARARGISLRVPREHWRELLFLALFNLTFWFVLAMYGVKLLSSGRAAILGYTLPIWSAVIGAWVFGEHPSRRVWGGVAAAALGVLLLVAGEAAALAGQPLGTVLMLAAAASWAYGTHLMRRRRQTTHVLTITFWSLAISLVVCGAIAAVFEHSSWTRNPSGGAWFAVCYNAFIIFGLVQVIWFRMASTLPPVASGLSLMLIPVIGLFSGALMLGEPITWMDLAALASIVVAMSTVLLPGRSR
ncbi:MAG: DMT family transporter [Burkholderiales bacterium]|nr:DMT family transporter [Burkholderiales bacterium]